ncbi:MAG: hypothetical protein FWC50_11160, partial [Planctomycetaceae bacterium]|nr:hypothetical protein [Planctomycetaceae bacterium]
MRKKNHHKSGQNNVPSATSSGSSQERQRGNAGIEQNAEQDAAVFRPKRSTRTINVPGQLFAVAFLEIFLVFAVFFVYGAWPVPDTNEPYYVGKAIHFWHPDTFKNDVFLNSHNTHWLFYQSFGWLSLFLAPDTMVWAGRIFLWLALAWGWYRLSRVLVAVPLFSVFSALMFACFM